jgi:hypothetical protein
MRRVPQGRAAGSTDPSRFTMSTIVCIALLAAATLLAGCESREDAVAGDAPDETTPANPVAPGEQETTPGGVAGETAATPPGTTPDNQSQGE